MFSHSVQKLLNAGFADMSVRFPGATWTPLEKPFGFSKDQHTQSNIHPSKMSILGKVKHSTFLCWMRRSAFVARTSRKMYAYFPPNIDT